MLTPVVALALLLLVTRVANCQVCTPIVTNGSLVGNGTLSTPLGVSAGVQITGTRTVGQLPVCNGTTAGTDLSVVDSDNNAWGQQCVHTVGSNAVGCHCDGVLWTVYAK